LLLVSFATLIDEVKSQQAGVGASTSSRLVNAANGADVGLLGDDQALLISTLPPAWAIIAISKGLVGSVGFNLDGNAKYRTDNAEP
jgi:hypothetical protein